MKAISIKNLFYLSTFVLTTLLCGQQNIESSIQRNSDLSYFETFKTFGGRPFTLHTDLVTENLSPVSSGLFYSIYDKEYLSSLNGDSVTPWEGAVCYFPKEIWTNTAAKVKYAQNDKNWMKITCLQGGNFIGSSYSFTGVEMSELNELLGLWYIHNPSDSSRDGMWYNGGDGVTKKFVVYYIKFN